MSALCPNCRSEDVEIVKNRLICGACDYSYKLTPDGAIPQEKGVISGLEERVRRLEESVSTGPEAESPQAEPEPASPDNLEPDPGPEPGPEKPKRRNIDLRFI